MSPQLIDGLIVAGFVALIGLQIALFARVRNLEIAIAEAKIQIGPLWAQVQSKVAQTLHHDDVRYAEMDKLLEDLIALRISPSNRIRLEMLLNERSVDATVSEEERKSAKLMIAVMDKAMSESSPSSGD